MFILRAQMFDHVEYQAGRPEIQKIGPAVRNRYCRALNGDLGDVWPAPQELPEIDIASCCLCRRWGPTCDQCRRTSTGPRDGRIIVLLNSGIETLLTLRGTGGAQPERHEQDIVQEGRILDWVLRDAWRSERCLCFLPAPRCLSRDASVLDVVDCRKSSGRLPCQPGLRFRSRRDHSRELRL